MKYEHVYALFLMVVFHTSCGGQNKPDGVGGTLRTGLSLKGQNLFYRINDKEILCGKIDLTKLMLRK